MLKVYTNVFKPSLAISSETIKAEQCDKLIFLFKKLSKIVKPSSIVLASTEYILALLDCDEPPLLSEDSVEGICTLIFRLPLSALSIPKYTTK